MSKNCVIVIPVYRKPTLIEQCSFNQCLKILSSYDIHIVTNADVDLSTFKEISRVYKYNFEVDFFEKHYFQGIKGYNSLCLSKDFYAHYADKYDYMLIYQLDAWVFKDELQLWCDKGYDYVGSPFFFSPDKGRTYTDKLIGVGNGGLSLRKIGYCLDLLNCPMSKSFLTKQKLAIMRDVDAAASQNSVLKKKVLIPIKYLLKRFGIRNSLSYYIKRINEDHIFSDYAANSNFISPNLPSPEEATAFAFEIHPSFLCEQNNNNLPFGCHAFEKYDFISFWSKFIPGDIDIPNIMKVTNPFPTASVFIQRYGDKLLKQYPALNTIEIRFCNQMPRNGGLTPNDTPYMEQKITCTLFEIHKDDDYIKRLELTTEDEMALVAHEFGHIIHILQGYKNNSMNDIEDEKFADHKAEEIVGKQNILSALQKMKQAGSPIPTDPILQSLGLLNKNSWQETIDQRMEAL